MIRIHFGSRYDIIIKFKIPFTKKGSELISSLLLVKGTIIYQGTKTILGLEEGKWNWIATCNLYRKSEEANIQKQIYFGDQGLITTTITITLTPKLQLEKNGDLNVLTFKRTVPLQKHFLLRFRTCLLLPLTISPHFTIVLVTSQTYIVWLCIKNFDRKML